MSKNWNLVNAQKLFEALTEGRVTAYDVHGKIDDMFLKLDQARKNGQPDLSIKALDATGKKSEQEVEEAISSVRRDAKLEIGVNHARYILGNMQAAKENGSTSPSYVYDNVRDALMDAGASIDIFTRGSQPALVEIDVLLKTYEKDIAAKKSAVKAGQAR